MYVPSSPSVAGPTHYHAATKIRSQTDLPMPQGRAGRCPPVIGVWARTRRGGGPFILGRLVVVLGGTVAG